MSLTQRATGRRRAGRLHVLPTLLALSCPACAAATLEEVYENARRHPIPAAATAVGTGFFVAPTTVLTSAHVLAGCESFGVENQHLGWLPAQLERVIADRDAALLSVSAPSGDILPLAAEAARGALTILGFPATAGGATDPVRARAEPVGMRDGPVLLLAGDVPAGFSGGPVLDGKGRVIAILTGRMNGTRRQLVASPVIALHDVLNLPQNSRLSEKAEAKDPSRGTVKIRCK